MLQLSRKRDFLLVCGPVGATREPGRWYCRLTMTAVNQPQPQAVGFFFLLLKVITMKDSVLLFKSILEHKNFVE